MFSGATQKCGSVRAVSISAGRYFFNVSLNYAKQVCIFNLWSTQ